AVREGDSHDDWNVAGAEPHGVDRGEASRSGHCHDNLRAEVALQRSPHLIGGALDVDPLELLTNLSTGLLRPIPNREELSEVPHQVALDRPIELVPPDPEMAARLFAQAAFAGQLSLLLPVKFDRQ